MINLTNDLIRDWIENAGLPRPADGKLHVCGVRGAVPVTETQITRVEGRLDHYDDSIILFGTELSAYRGTTDPGKYYTLRPLHPDGCAHMADGGPYPYQLGFHKGHRALVQAAKVAFWRDKDKDNRQDPSERVQRGMIGLNVHAGSPTSTIGKWSAGCWVFACNWSGDDWEDFLGYCEASGQPTFNLYLLDGKKLRVP
jgi:hypothetical protein